MRVPAPTETPASRSMPSTGAVGAGTMIEPLRSTRFTSSAVLPRPVPPLERQAGRRSLPFLSWSRRITGDPTTTSITRRSRCSHWNGEYCTSIHGASSSAGPRRSANHTRGLISRTRWNGLPRMLPISSWTSLRWASTPFTSSVSSCATSSVRCAKYSSADPSAIPTSAATAAAASSTSLRTVQRTGWGTRSTASPTAWPSSLTSCFRSSTIPCGGSGGSLPGECSVPEVMRASSCPQARSCGHCIRMPARSRTGTGRGRACRRGARHRRAGGRAAATR